MKTVPERFGNYTIHEQLGAGGLATVHLAESPAIKSRVALKRMYPHVADIQELVTAFVDEARLARYLGHPNIARVYEFGRTRGVYWIAFEFVPGPTVQQLQKQCLLANLGSIPVPVVLEIASQVCDALDHAHKLRDEHGRPLGIVHRDVTPSNLIVSNTGLVKLIDFGLAKTKQSSVQSQAGIIKGKLAYVAPEYLRGKLDARCDLWALGVVMWELLTGRRLFEAPDDRLTLERVRLAAITPPSKINAEVPPELDHIVLTALDRDPAQRWFSAAAMGDAIKNLARTRSITKQQLVAWMEWAFSQKEPQRREDSAVSALHDIISSPSIEEIEISAITEAEMTRRRDSIAMMPLVGQAMLERRASSWAMWLMLLLLVGAAAVAAWKLKLF